MLPGLAFAGVGVAILSGVTAAVLAWREHGRAVENLGRREVEMMQGFSERLHQERATQGEVLAAVERRDASLREELTKVRADAGELRQDLSQLRGDFEALNVTHNELKTSHDELVERLKAEDPADVVSLPRRRTTDGGEIAFDEAPTVAELNLQRLVAPFVEEAMRQAN
jgi:chromosome segregation ATPase